MVDPTRVFLDANILAKPLTRTLLIVGGPLSSYVPIWSDRALTEADRHLGPGRTPVADLVTRFGWTLGPTACVGTRFPKTAASDRQLLADAEAGGASYLISEDVDDFDEDDLMSVGISAVNPDLFLCARLTASAYQEALETLGRNRQRPPSTPAEIHAALGRNHPLLVARFASMFATPVAERVQAEPAVVFRGSRCLRCGANLAVSTDFERGLGPECRTSRAGSVPAEVVPDLAEDLSGSAAGCRNSPT